MSTWYVYLLRCSDKSLYCGVTTDPERRLKEHNSGTGAKYTRCRIPVAFEVYESFPDKRAAYRAEYAVKKKSANQKVQFLKELATQAAKQEQSEKNTCEAQSIKKVRRASNQLTQIQTKNLKSG